MTHHNINCRIFDKEIKIKFPLFFLSTTLSATLHIIAKNQSKLSLMYRGLHEQFGYCVGFYWNWNYPVRYSKKSQASKVMKIRTVGADLFLEEIRTDKHGEDNYSF